MVKRPDRIIDIWDQIQVWLWSGSLEHSNGRVTESLSIELRNECRLIGIHSMWGRLFWLDRTKFYYLRNSRTNSFQVGETCSIPIPQSDLDQSKVGLIRWDRHVGHYIWIVLVMSRRYCLSEHSSWACRTNLDGFRQGSRTCHPRSFSQCVDWLVYVLTWTDTELNMNWLAKENGGNG